MNYDLLQQEMGLATGIVVTMVVTHDSEEQANWKEPSRLGGRRRIQQIVSNRMVFNFVWILVYSSVH
jgi:hypothetical protein